jgi:hypothetical protein
MLPPLLPVRDALPPESDRWRLGLGLERSAETAVNANGDKRGGGIHQHRLIPSIDECASCKCSGSEDTSEELPKDGIFGEIWLHSCE